MHNFPVGLSFRLMGQIKAIFHSFLIQFQKSSGTQTYMCILFFFQISRNILFHERNSLVNAAFNSVDLSCSREVLFISELTNQHPTTILDRIKGMWEKYCQFG